MSYRHPLQQTYTADYSTTKRQPSNASTASTAYSHSSGAFDLSRTSTLSSTVSSGYSGHKRGLSEAPGMSPSTLTSTGGRTSQESSPSNAYKSVRQSLRPLPQPPSASPPRRDHGDYQHSRAKSVEVSRPEYHGEFAPVNSVVRTAGVRPNSMVLSRSDSINRTSRSATLQHQHSPLAAPDLQSLQKSSTSQLRTLSKFAESGAAEDFTITAPSQEVAGLHGRRRLQRSDKTNSEQNSGAISRSNGYGWEGRNWMDKKRQFLQAYEYLCHIGEAKEWIEDILQRPIPPIVQLEETLRDGVTLAEIVDSLYPERRIRIFRHPKLQFRHSDNIAVFFRFLAELELPDLFRFELIDLYEKKNIPKVIYCIHALSWLLYRKSIVDFTIGNLVGKLEFEHHELEAVQKGLDMAGVSMPSFGNMGADFGVEPTPEPEPVESEEDRIDRELGENEGAVLDLQAQIRGAALRMQLGHTMQRLWDSEEMLIQLQSRIRGDFTRQIVGYRLGMRLFAINLQSRARGFLVRQRQLSQESFWKSREADVLHIQSLIRAKKARDEVRMMRSQLRSQEPIAKALQASIRGFLTRKGLAAQEKEAKSMAGPVKSLQAAIRGMLLRHEVAQDQEHLWREANSISAVQASVRAMLIRNQVSRQREALEKSQPIWRALQAVSRGVLVRKQFQSTVKSLKAHSPDITTIQAFVRAAAVRRDIASTLSALQQQESPILELQTNIRGMLLRNGVAKDRKILDSHTSQITHLQAHSRGYLLRQRNGALLSTLQSNQAEIVQLQALCRAVLLRNDIGMLLGELESEEESIVELQAAVNAFLVRARFAEKQRFFKENMQKVVKLQSFVRGKLQGEAYKSLTTGKNPPVNTVKNFVHLLNDSDFDFNEEIEFERSRKTVVQQVRQNEMAEQYIDQLDIKIALLVKNKITLDEVVKHQRNFGGHSGNLLVNTSMASGNHFDLKALNKN